MNEQLLYTNILDTILEYMTQTDRSFLKMTCNKYYKDTRLKKKLKMNLYELLTKEQILWAKKQNYTKVWKSELYMSFALKGDLEMIKWLRDRNQHHIICKWKKDVCTYASKGGHLNILKWVRSQTPKCSWDEWLCTEAAKNGHLDIIQWVRSQDPPCPWNSDVCRWAAKNGHLDILQWARSQNPPCPWNNSVCLEAVCNGHFEIIKWAQSQDPPCPWTFSVCSVAAERGYFDLLKWIQSRGLLCPIEVATSGVEHFEIVEWLYYNYRNVVSERLCYSAIRCDKIKVLELIRDQDNDDSFYAHENELCLDAAQFGRLEILKWLRSPYKNRPPCKWNSSICKVAAYHGHLETTEWVLQHWKDNVGIMNDVWYFSVQSCSENICLWLYSKNYQPPKNLYPNILYYGLLTFIKLLREKNDIYINSIWIPELYIKAAIKNDMEYIKWLQTGGDNYPPCPVDKKTRSEYYMHYGMLKKFISI